MTSEGLGEMFEGAGKFPLVSMGGGAEGLACADTGARTPIGASGNMISFHLLLKTANNFTWYNYFSPRPHEQIFCLLLRFLSEISPDPPNICYLSHF